MKIKVSTLQGIIREAILENHDLLLIEAPGDDIQTVEDLKALINKAIRKKKFKAAAKAGIEGVLDVVPGLGVAKSVGGVLKALYSLPDNTRPKGPLGNLDVDDDVSVIVDDPIENKFLNYMAKRLESMPNNTPLSSINMTNLLADYISSKFNKRTVVGFDQ